MATMISEVYEAFRSVGVAEDKARAAAEALSEDQLATKADILKLERVTTSEIARLELVTKGDIARLETVTKGEIAKMDKEVTVVKWMLGLVIVAVVIPLLKPFLG